MAKKRQIAVADCETDPFKKGRVKINPFIWGYYDGDDYQSFDTTKEFIDFVSGKNIILYAHNGGKFDWLFLSEYFDSFTELMIINGRLSKFKIGECEFRDSYNLLPVPLSAYKKTEISYDIFEEGEREKPENMREIKKYLRDDCIYLFDLVSEFVRGYGSGLTLAGSAMKFWQKEFKNEAPKTSHTFYNELKKFYYGGRVECFASGVARKNFKVVDINSAYPYGMKHLHPYGNKFDVSDTLPKTEKAIQRCFITVECISRGAFPYRTKTGLIFPNDNEKRRYFISGWEYLAAIETNSIFDEKIIEVISFSDSIRFDDYIDHFYELKNDSQRESAQYIIAKLFLNSLYGKFAANPEDYQEFMVVEPKHIMAAQSDGYEFNSMLGEFALMEKPLAEEKQHYYNVAVAASITGFVRAYLFRALKNCDGVIYCDTDSIAAENVERLELSETALGAWKVEAECDWYAVGGKKLYCFHKVDGGYKKASKGARLTFSQIVKVAKGVPQIYEPIAPSFSIKTGIKTLKRKIAKNV